jgi:hypothetical protein
LDNRKPAQADDGTDLATRLGQGKINFRNPEAAALYQAAKASPREFAPVYVYAKAVADVSMASLVDKRCETCVEGSVRYRPRSELEPRYWPIIEDALAMLEDLAGVPGLTMEQMDRLLATKGRLLWIAGRSMEEQNMIDEYARAHPNAVAVVRRRLELLREAGDGEGLDAQCARSRAKTASSPDEARVDLLTACVAFHLDNTEGRSDMVDFARFLPNLTPAEDALYRGNLMQRCVDKVGDEGARCHEVCACEETDSGKRPTAKCKKACSGCRKETAQKLSLCQKLGEAPPPPAPVAARPSRKKGAAAHRRKSAPVPKFGPPKPTAKQKREDKMLQAMEL